MKRLIYILVFFIGWIGQAEGQKIYEYGKMMEGEDYTVVETNSGIADLYTDALDAVTLEVIDSIKSLEGKDLNMRVLGCDFYTLLRGSKEKYEDLVAAAVDTISSQNTDYLFIIKDFTTDNKANYRIKFNITGLSPAPNNSFSKLGNKEVAFQAIEDRVLRAIDFQAYTDDRNIKKSADAEIAGLRELLRIIEEVKLDDFRPNRCSSNEILGEMIKESAFVNTLLIADPAPTLLKEDVAKNQNDDPVYFKFSEDGALYALTDLVTSLENEIVNDIYYRYDRAISVESYSYIYSDETCDDFRNKYDQFKNSSAPVSMFYAYIRSSDLGVVLAILVNTSGDLISSNVIEDEQIKLKNDLSGFYNSTTSKDRLGVVSEIQNGLSLKRAAGLENQLAELYQLVDDLEKKVSAGSASEYKRYIDYCNSGHEDIYRYDETQEAGYKQLKFRTLSIISFLNGSLYYENEITHRNNAQLEYLSFFIESMVCTKNDPGYFSFYWNGSFKDYLSSHVIFGREYQNLLELGDIEVNRVVLKEPSSPGEIRIGSKLPTIEKIKVKVSGRGKSGGRWVWPETPVYAFTFASENGDFNISFTVKGEDQKQSLETRIQQLYLNANAFNESYYNAKAKTLDLFINNNKRSISGIDAAESILFSSSKCTYEYLPFDLRNKIIDFYYQPKENNTSDREELVISNCFGYINVENGFYKEFMEKLNVDFDLLPLLGRSIDGTAARKAFVGNTSLLHQKYLKSLSDAERYDKSLSPKADVNLDNLQLDDFVIENRYDDIDIGYLSSEKKYSFKISTILIRPFGGAPAPYKEPDANFGKFKLYDNIRLRSSEYFGKRIDSDLNIIANSGTVPFITLGFITENISDDNLQRGSFAAIDIAFLAVGVGELNAAIKTLRAFKGASRAGWARAITSTLDIVSGAGGIICSTDNSASCVQHKRYVEPFVLGGAIGGGIAEAYARNGLLRLDLMGVAARGLDDIPPLPNFYRFLDNANVEIDDASVFRYLADDVLGSSGGVATLNRLEADLARASSNLLETLTENPKLVIPWNFLNGSPEIRLVKENLENMGEVLDVEFWRLADVSFADFQKTVNESTSKKRFIEQLKAASSEGGGIGEFEDALRLKNKTIDVELELPNGISGLDNASLVKGSEINSEAVSTAKSNLDDLLKERKLAEGRASATKAEKIELSENIAEARTDLIYLENGWKRLDLDDIPPGKQGKFDRVYLGPNGELHVIEAKGVRAGEPSFGARVSSNDDVVQQGTAAYRDDIIANLLDKLPETSELRIKLQQVIRDEEPITYILVRQVTLKENEFVHKVFVE